jgi:hypothetical protein
MMYVHYQNKAGPNEKNVTCARDKFKTTVMRLYGESINEYARGCEPMESEAIDVCIPAVIAISLPEEYASIVLMF